MRTSAALAVLTIVIAVAATAGVERPVVAAETLAVETRNGEPQMPPQPKFAVDRGLYPFEDHWLKLDNGAVVHYVEEGEGPVLLLLHGNPTWSFLYRKMMSGLKDKFRVIAPDYPGFGLSSAPAGYGFTAAEQAEAMAEFVDRLGLSDYTIMMQDWGGPIGFSLALRHPERVHGFVIGNTWAWPLMRTGQHIFSRLMGGPIGRGMAWCCNGIVRVFMKIGLAKSLDERALAMYLAPFEGASDRAPTHIFPRELRAAEPFLADIHQRLPALSGKPTLIVWGAKDFAFQEGERTRFETLFPNHNTVMLPDAGHFIQEDAPDDIVAAIRQWFPGSTRPVQGGAARE